MLQAKVYLTRPIPDAGIEILRKQISDFHMNEEDRVLSPEELKQAVKGCDGILSLLTDKMDADVMDAAGPQLKVIANYAVGFDNIDLQAATERGILVTNTPGVLTDATADFAWALLMATARRIPESERYARAGKYKAWGPKLFLGGDFVGRTLGIVGAGRIGSAMAKRATGWNMRILYTDVQPNPNIEKEVGAQFVDMDTLLQESDYISIHVPLTPETHHLIDEAALRKMKPTAYLVNTSRGPVIDEAALARALKEKVIAGAGLDVFEEEPKIHPGLLELENVVITPHIASATHETRNKMATMAATNLIEALRSNRPPNLVNVDVWKD
ncbi:MAG: D-glycerate dehydrogenase [candidate division KSB1 bacterium]|nr:D-glycerate dehydrogenase [candidate division KSB1 bacterium]MDQ7065552.1 D-glycerate dehydrogenase [candidate division KSB1 bacterium]